MSHKIGAQLIVFGDRYNTDLPGVLADCKAAGYDGVETGTLNDTMELSFLKDTFAANNLLLSGIHGGLAAVSDPATVERHIAYLHDMNAKYLIASGVADAEGIRAYEIAAEVYNKAGQVCKAAGITFCYHNHAFEFASFDGVKGIDRLAELTDPDAVKLNIDVYWVAMGGESPAEFIARYANRAGYYHFKDGGRKGEGEWPWWFTELGKGDVDVPAALKAATSAGCDWLVTEQDQTKQDAAVSVKESFDYLKSIGA